MTRPPIPPNCKHFIELSSGWHFDFAIRSGARHSLTPIDNPEDARDVIAAVAYVAWLDEAHRIVADQDFMEWCEKSQEGYDNADAWLEWRKA